MTSAGLARLVNSVLISLGLLLAVLVTLMLLASVGGLGWWIVVGAPAITVGAALLVTGWGVRWRSGVVLEHDTDSRGARVRRLRVRRASRTSMAGFACAVGLFLVVAAVIVWIQTVVVLPR